MTEFTPITATLGGLLIGTAAALMLLFEGRIAGISGILSGVMRRRGDADAPPAWQATFLGGMILGGIVLLLVNPAVVTTQLTFSPVLLVVAGLLVGFGTRLGNGCTSGHGVCGIPRLSRRSITATMTFMGMAMLTVFITSALGIGGAA